MDNVNQTITPNNPTTNTNNSDLYTAVANIQKQVQSIKPDAVNNFKGNKYISLSKIVEELQPLMSQENLVILSQITEKGIEHILIHTPSRQTWSIQFPLLALNNYQEMGSAITYTRRYAMMLFFNIVVDPDDDGNLTTQEYKRHVHQNSPSNPNPNHNPNPTTNTFTPKKTSQFAPNTDFLKK